MYGNVRAQGPFKYCGAAGMGCSSRRPSALLYQYVAQVRLTACPREQNILIQLITWRLLSHLRSGCVCTSMRGCQFLAVSDEKPPGNVHCREQLAVVLVHADTWLQRCPTRVRYPSGVYAHPCTSWFEGPDVLCEPANAVKLLQTR